MALPITGINEQYNAVHFTKGPTQKDGARPALATRERGGFWRLWWSVKVSGDQGQHLGECLQ